MIMKLRLTILTLLFKFTLCRDFYVGMLKKNDLIVAKDSLYKEKKYFGYTTAEYGRVFRCPITYIRVSNRVGTEHLPAVSITRGGLQKKYVTLDLTSYNAPIDVIIYIGCKNKITKAVATTTVATTKVTPKRVATTRVFSVESTAPVLDEFEVTTEGPRGLKCGDNQFDKLARFDFEWSDGAGGWFKYYPTPATWAEARYTCHAEGANLVSPLSKKLTSALKSFIQKKLSHKHHDVTIFIGVHATFSEGDYSSIEGMPLRRLEITWASGEPDNHENAERCLAMTIDSFDFETVADTRCDRTLPYVCYKKDTEHNFRSDYEWSEQAGGWLKYHVIPATWENAKPRCQAEGAVLASPLNSQLEAAIVAIVQRQEVFHEEGMTIFTGVQQTSKGKFMSIEGKSLEQMSISWLSEEPHNAASESCLAMRIRQKGAMTNTRCDMPLPYVCYKEHTTLTMSACGTDPDYQLKPETGRCYKLHKELLSWHDAYMTCEAEGGYLVVINSQDETKVVVNVVKSTMFEQFTFIGFFNWCHNAGKDFRTIHGESVDMNHIAWSPGEPNNRITDEFGEDCGTLQSGSWAMNDIMCITLAPFLCEKMPNSLSNDLNI